MPASSDPRPRPPRSPRAGADAPTRGGLRAAAPAGPRAPAAATHRSGGLPGGGHDGGQRGRHVVAAHPPAGGQRVGSGRERRRPAVEGRVSPESQPAPPGARSGAPPAPAPRARPRLGRACTSQCGFPRPAGAERARADLGLPLLAGRAGRAAGDQDRNQVGRASTCCGPCALDSQSTSPNRSALLTNGQGFIEIY